MPRSLSLADVPALDRLLRGDRGEPIILTDEAGTPLAAVVPYGELGDEDSRNAGRADHQQIVDAAARLSESSLAAIWSCPEDAVYDDL